MASRKADTVTLTTVVGLRVIPIGKAVLSMKQARVKPPSLRVTTSLFLSRPSVKNNVMKLRQGCLLFSGSFDEEALLLLRQTAAAVMLIKEDYNRSVMENRYAKLRPRFVEKMIKAYLETGLVRTDLMKKSVKSLISREFSNFDELFSEIKPRLLEEIFEKRYPQHPCFTRQITRDNIVGEFNAALREILQKNGVQALFANAKSVLSALELIDADGNLSTVGSKVAREIIKIAGKNQGCQCRCAKTATAFQRRALWLRSPMTAFVIVMLTYNGEISLRCRWQGGLLFGSAKF